MVTLLVTFRRVTSGARRHGCDDPESNEHDDERVGALLRE